MEQYNKLEGVRWSHLKYMRRSPAHVKAQMDAPPRSTSSMLKGSVVDCALTQPELLTKKYFLLPEFNWNSKANKEKAVQQFAEMFDYTIDPHELLTKKKGEVLQWLQDATGKTPLEADLFEQCKGMASSVLEHKTATKILKSSAEKQMEIQWQDEATGILCKGLIDLYSSDMKALIDAKTTENAKHTAFQNQAARFDYFGQLAWYRRGLVANGHEVESTAFLVVENAQPYAVKIYEATKACLLFADERIDEYLKRYKYCLDSGKWPGYSTEVASLDAPEWYYSEQI